MRKNIVRKLNKVMTLCVVALMVFSASITFAFAEAEPFRSASQEQLSTGAYVPPQAQPKTVYLHVNQVVRNQQGTKLYDSVGYSYFIRPTNDAPKYPAFGTTDNKDCTITTNDSDGAKTPEIVITEEWFEAAAAGQKEVVLTYDISQERIDDNDDVVQDDQTAKAIVTVSKDEETGEFIVEQTYQFKTYDGSAVESEESAFFTNVVSDANEVVYDYVDVPEDSKDKDIYGEIEYCDDQVKTGDATTVILWYIAMCLCYLDFVLIVKSRKARRH